MAFVGIAIGSLLSIIPTLYVFEKQAHAEGAVVAKLLLSDNAEVERRCRDMVGLIKRNRAAHIFGGEVPIQAWRVAAAESDFVAELNDADVEKAQLFYRRVDSLNAFLTYYEERQGEAMPGVSMPDLDRDVVRRCEELKPGLRDVNAILQRRRAHYEYEQYTDGISLIAGVAGGLVIALSLALWIGLANRRSKKPA